MPSRHTPIEALVERMRANIEVKTVEGSESFRVSYVGSDPEVVTKVTARLAGLFIEENTRDRNALAQQTSAFLESQLENARTRLVEQEKRLEAYRLKYGTELPTQLQSNIQVIQNTETQIQSLSEAINRDRDRRLLVARQLADIQSEQYLADPSARAPAPTAASQLDAAVADLAALELRLTPQHPDVLRARQSVAELERRARQEANATRSSTELKPLTPSEIAKRNRVKELEAEIESLDRQVADKVAEQKTLQTAREGYQLRVEAVPTRESELAAITRDYDTLQSLYRTLLAKKEDSKIAENLEQRQVGEQFKILDAPHPPQKPSSPNRMLIDLGGALAGIALGVALAGLLAYFDKRVSVEADLRAAIDLPILAMIPTVMGPEDHRRVRWRHAQATLGLGALVAACAVVVWFRFRL